MNMNLVDVINFLRRAFFKLHLCIYLVSFGVDVFWIFFHFHPISLIFRSIFIEGQNIVKIQVLLMLC